MTPARKIATPGAPRTTQGESATASRKAPAKPTTKPKQPRQHRLPKPEWDICDVDQWGPEEHELGATIPQAGNSIYNITGGWRSQVPVIDSEKCNGCMLCYFYCPDASIIVDCDQVTGAEKVTGFDLDHCKGCGICAKECPQGAITTKVEKKE
jgi:pyruvate ferredoxin oxidoreductase delta subunit